MKSFLKRGGEGGHTESSLNFKNHFSQWVFFYNLFIFMVAFQTLWCVVWCYFIYLISPFQGRVTCQSQDGGLLHPDFKWRGWWKDFFFAFKFAIPGFFWIGRFSKYFFGWLDLRMDFLGVFRTIWRFIVGLAYDNFRWCDKEAKTNIQFLVVSFIHVIPFHAFWKFLRLGNLAWDFLGS